MSAPVLLFCLGVFCATAVLFAWLLTPPQCPEEAIYRGSRRRCRLAAGHEPWRHEWEVA